MKPIEIPWAQPFLKGNENKYVLDALDSTWISGGTYVNTFETGFGAFLNTPYGITASNGTTALHCALLALSIGPGDEVIVPGFGFVAALNMVIMVGATPVYADIDHRTWCIDPKAVAQSISARTKAIIAIHTYGNMCDMERLNTIADNNNLALIEDTAEALGSRYNNQHAGTIGTIGCFSFQTTKTLAMGEGGFVTTSDETLYNRMHIIRDHGMSKDRKYWHEMVGHNFRLTNIHAAIGCAQLEYIDAIITERKRVAECYTRELSGIPGIALQHVTENVSPIIWTIGVSINPAIFGQTRDEIIAHLLENGIETRPGFYTPREMLLYDAPPLPIAETISNTIVCLPSFCSL